jgi:hypothetical protein
LSPLTCESISFAINEIAQSMSRFTFTLACSEDDPQLRARMAEDRMDGSISVSFRREPDYFAGSRLQGDEVQVIVCRDTLNGRIAGLGSRCAARFHVNGTPMRAGYLADLRCDPAYRKGTLLPRGYRFLHELQRADPLPAYSTIIFESNRAALQSLVGNRAGLPAYLPMGRMLTPAIHLDFAKPDIHVPGIALRRSQPGDLEHIVAFLNRRMATRQFSPVYRPSDFLPGGRCAGMTPSSFYLAERDGALVGTIAAWDQAAIRQTHIERYSSALSVMRPFYNLASRFTALKSLPAVGARIPYLYLCCVAIENDDVDVFRSLLRFIYNQLRNGLWHYAIAGLHERDPLASVLAEYRAISAAGLLYRVELPRQMDAGPEPVVPDDRVPYFEMALA